MQVKIVASGDLHIVADDLDRRELQKLRDREGPGFHATDISYDVIRPLIDIGYSLTFNKRGQHCIVTDKGEEWNYEPATENIPSSIQYDLLTSGTAKFIKEK